ncbi:MAG: hypothetical protein IIV90_01370 [Oscillospiraceae bacterium]|nr:hypothetical protein [Oscillospiraceae bacterium]
MQNVVQDFELIRSTLRTLFVRGSYQPSRAKSEKNRLLILQAVFGTLLKEEEDGWRLSYDPFSQETNYLFEAFALCALRNKTNVVRPALVLQALAQPKYAGGLTVEQFTELLSNLLPAPEEGGGKKTFEQTYQESRSLDPRPVAKTLEQMVKDGRLVKQKIGRNAPVYRLPALLPAALEGMTDEAYQEQLNLLVWLIPLLADRLMPQSWGYRSRDTLRRELERRNWYKAPARPLLTQKKHSRYQLMLDDEVLWKLADAHCQGQAVRLEYRMEELDQTQLSCQLQPLALLTDTREGRTILLARPLEKDAPPAVLPLDLISRVYSQTPAGFWLSAPEADAYREAWFGRSRTGWSPLAPRPDGKPGPAAPAWVTARFAPEGDPEAFARRLRRNKRDEVFVEEETGRVVLKATLSRPQELEPLLFEHRKALAEVESSDAGFAESFALRLQLLKDTGAAQPPAPMAWRYPPRGAGRPGDSAASVELFDPFQNRAVQTTLDLTLQACRSRAGSVTLTPVQARDPDLMDLLESGVLGSLERFWESEGGRRREKLRFTPALACAPAMPFTWPEQEWLLAFLASPPAQALLEESFCTGLSSWLRQNLNDAQAAGLYQAHYRGDFFRMLSARQRETMAPGALKEAALALYRGVGLKAANRVGFGEDARRMESVGIPTRLEYEAGRDLLFLMMVPLETDGQPAPALRQVRMQGGRLESLQTLDTLPGTPAQQEEARAWLGRRRAEKKMKATLRVWAGLEDQACARLRPYDMTTARTEGGALLIQLHYVDFERRDVLKDLTSLLPGVVLEKAGTDPVLFEEFGEG